MIRYQTRLHFFRPVVDGEGEGRPACKFERGSKTKKNLDFVSISVVETSLWEVFRGEQEGVYIFTFDPLRGAGGGQRVQILTLDLTLFHSSYCYAF